MDFHWIHWFCRTLSYVRTLEIAWWWRTGAGIMSSWHTWNILVKRAGIRRPLTSRHEIDTVRFMDANSRTLTCNYLPVVYAFWLLMSFIGLPRGMGVNLLIEFNFYGPSKQCWRRSTLLREDDDRSAWRRKQEYSICFSSIVCVHKKLLLGRWCILVLSMKFSSHSHQE